MTYELLKLKNELGKLLLQIKSRLSDYDNKVSNAQMKFLEWADWLNNKSKQINIDLLIKQ